MRTRTARARRRSPRRSGGSEGRRGRSAAVVGVIANLGGWFAVQVLFAERTTVAGLGARVLVPVLPTVDPAAVVIAVGAGVALDYARQSVPRTLVAAAVLGAGYNYSSDERTRRDRVHVGEIVTIGPRAQNGSVGSGP